MSDSQTALQTTSRIEDFDQWNTLKNTSRTFYLSIRQLPTKIGNAFCLAYLLLRVSDFFEDNEFMPPEEKIYWLNTWEEVLAGKPFPKDWQEKLKDFASQDPDAFAAFYADELLNLVALLPSGLQKKIVPIVQATTRGMARWVARGPVVLQEEDMDDYMFEVAGRVGYLSTEVFAWYSKAIQSRQDLLMPLAKETGLALQTVNILRGLRKDFERGWIYVPESYCDLVGINRGELFSSENEEKILKLVEILADKAERHLTSAIEYIKVIPPHEHKVRLACIWPLMFAARTISVSRNNLEVLKGTAKVSREEIQQIIKTTTLFGWSNRFIESYYSRLLHSTAKSL